MEAEHLLIFPDRETAEDVAADLEHEGFDGVRVVREALAGEDDSEDHEWPSTSSRPPCSRMPLSSPSAPVTWVGGTTPLRRVEWNRLNFVQVDPHGTVPVQENAWIFS